ncbi:hypothetical protein GCM10025857_31330 [Alicyclobacillus contaminans]|nr:hypothetical protein GCM10025857_31330 [Alicyclobacillus contaminans]
MPNKNRANSAAPKLNIRVTSPILLDVRTRAVYIRYEEAETLSKADIPPRQGTSVVGRTNPQMPRTMFILFFLRVTLSTSLSE